LFHYSLVAINPLPEPISLHVIVFVFAGSGLGSLRHNTVIVGWPDKWKEQPQSVNVFLEAIKVTSGLQLALLIPKNIHQVSLCSVIFVIRFK
jgi:hypothetical protein